jgi:hypothetical protein
LIPNICGPTFKQKLLWPQQLCIARNRGKKEMKKLALISGLLFVIVYFWANTFMPDDDNADTYYPATVNASISRAETTNEATLLMLPERDDSATAGEGYYLILASFNEISQAQQAADKYSAEYNAGVTVLPKTQEGYYRISYGKYSALSDAESALSSVRENINPSAWLLAAR